MTTPRRMLVTTALLLIAALTMSVTPVAAKKGGGGAPPPADLADVSFTLLDGYDGLGGDLKMQMNSKGKTTAYEAGYGLSSRLYLRGFDGMEGWHDGIPILSDECPPADEPLEDRGLVHVRFDRDGVLEMVVWYFDWLIGPDRKGQCRNLVEERYHVRALEPHELGPGEPPLTYENGVVSGTFKLHLYDRDAPETHVDLGHTYMEFGLTIAGG